MGEYISASSFLHHGVDDQVRVTNVLVALINDASLRAKTIISIILALRLCAWTSFMVHQIPLVCSSQMNSEIRCLTRRLLWLEPRYGHY